MRTATSDAWPRQCGTGAPLIAYNDLISTITQIIAAYEPGDFLRWWCHSRLATRRLAAASAYGICIGIYSDTRSCETRLAPKRCLNALITAAVGQYWKLQPRFAAQFSTGGVTGTNRGEFNAVRGGNVNASQNSAANGSR